MKIFVLNDCDWWVAETLEQAKESYKLETGEDSDDDARELTEEEMDHHIITSEDGVKRTFREELRLRTEDGTLFPPTLFASTEY
jgi:hypothetical protein